MSEPITRSGREKRTPGRKALATRRRLVEAAARLFAEQGYERTSVRDLGLQLEMTTGAIYRHFRNKAELLAAAVADAIAEQVDDPPGIQTLSTYREGAADLLASHPDQAALRALLLDSAAAAKSDPAVRDRLRDIQLERIAAWTAVALRDQEKGALDAEVDAETLVKLLWALEFGLVIFDIFGMAPPDPEQTGVVVNRLLKPTAETAPSKPTGRKARKAPTRRKSRGQRKAERVPGKT